MRIDNNINYCHFGMAVKYTPSEIKVKNYILRNKSPRKITKMKSILAQLSMNRAETNLTLNEHNKLQAMVGDNIFKENLFNGKSGVLRKALKASNEESQIDLIVDVLRILSKDG